MSPAALDARPQRSAWLTYADGTGRLDLDDDAAGYRCLELDLGWPNIRDVTNNKPDAAGTDDRTRLFGSRAITASMMAFPGGTLNADEIVAKFRPLHATERPATVALHHRCRSRRTVDDAPGREALSADERSGDPTVPVVVGGTGPDAVRACLVTSPHILPRIDAIGQMGQTYSVHVNGDLPAWPIYSFYGPVTRPGVQVSTSPRPG